MKPAVAVMTTAAAFDATVVSHGHAAPPAHPSTAPLHVEQTAAVEGRLRRMSNMITLADEFELSNPLLVKTLNEETTSLNEEVLVEIATPR